MFNTDDGGKSLKIFVIIAFGIVGETLTIASLYSVRSNGLNSESLIVLAITVLIDIVLFGAVVFILWRKRSAGASLGKEYNVQISSGELLYLMFGKVLL